MDYNFMDTASFQGKVHQEAEVSQAFLRVRALVGPSPSASCMAAIGVAATLLGEAAAAHDGTVDFRGKLLEFVQDNFDKGGE